MATKTEIIICGALGGISTNLFGIGAQLVGGTVELPSTARMITYAVGLVVLSALGGLAAYISDEKIKKKAFYIGIGLPAFFRLAISDVTATKPVPVDAPTVEISRSFSLVPFAYADPPRRVPAVVPSGRTLLLKMQPVENVKIVFSAADRSRSETVSLPMDATPQGIRIPIPDYAAGFTIKRGGSTSAYVNWQRPLDPTESFTVQLKENKWSGFQSAIGNQNAQAYRISITPAP